MSYIPVIAGEIIEAESVNLLASGAAYFSVDNGNSANVYKVKFDGTTSNANAMGSLENGTIINFIAAHTNSGASTLEVIGASGSLGVKDIKKQGSTALVSGDIQTGQVVTVIYNVTSNRFELVTSTGSFSGVIDASQVTSGLLARARGGVGINLDATGGASRFLAQTSLGGAISVSQPTLADLAAGTLGVDLPLSGVARFVGAGTADSAKTQIYADANAGNLLENVPTGKFSRRGVAGSGLLSLGHAFTTQGDTLWGIGLYCANGASNAGNTGIGVSGSSIVHNVPTGGLHKLAWQNVEKYRFGAALMECDRLSLGGTIGSSVDPGAGGFYCTGDAKILGQLTMAATTGAIKTAPSATGVMLQIGNGTATSSGVSIYANAYDGGSQRGSLFLQAGNVAGARVVVQDKNGTTQLAVSENGVAVGGKFAINGNTPMTTQTGGGARTAGSSYGSTEQTMLQLVYNLARVFGFLD